MKTLRMFLILAMIPFLAAGGKQQVMTGHNRVVGTAACVPPTLTYRWAPNAAADCGGACSNGNAMQQITDFVAANTVTQSNAAQRPVYQGSQINGQPAAVFTTANSSAFSPMGTALPTSGQISGYAVFNTTSTANAEAMIGPPSSGNLEFQVNIGGTIRLTSSFIISIASGNTVSTGTWYFETFTYDFSSGNAVIYRCQSGSCTSQGSGSHSVSGAAVNTIGAASGGHFFSGSIAEVGILNGSLSTSGMGAYALCKFGI